MMMKMLDDGCFGLGFYSTGCKSASAMQTSESSTPNSIPQL